MSVLDDQKSKCSFCTFCLSAQDGNPYDLNKQLLLLIDTAELSTKYTLRSLGGAVCVLLCKRKKMKQVTCTTRTQLTPTDYFLTPQNRHCTSRFSMYQVTKHPFPHKLYSLLSMHYSTWVWLYACVCIIGKR